LTILLWTKKKQDFITGSPSSVESVYCSW
jgi:hypothetical protein